MFFRMAFSQISLYISTCTDRYLIEIYNNSITHINMDIFYIATVKNVIQISEKKNEIHISYCKCFKEG